MGVMHYPIYANVQCNLQGGQLLIQLLISQLLISLLHGYAYNRHRQSQFGCNLFSHAYSRSDLQSLDSCELHFIQQLTYILNYILCCI